MALLFAHNAYNSHNYDKTDRKANKYLPSYELSTKENSRKKQGNSSKLKNVRKL